MGGERERKTKSCYFLIFLDAAFIFKATEQFVMSFFSIFVKLLTLKCAVEYYRTSNRCFQLVIFAVIFRYFRGRVLQDSIACAVNPCKSLL